MVPTECVHVNTVHQKDTRHTKMIKYFIKSDPISDCVTNQKHVMGYRKRFSVSLNSQNPINTIVGNYYTYLPSLTL